MNRHRQHLRGVLAVKNNYPRAYIAICLPACGLMIGSALVYPILVNEPKVYQNVLLPIFLVSCLVFNILQVPIFFEYGHITLLIMLVLVLLAISSNRATADCIPWIPMMVMFASLLNISMPKLHQLSRGIIFSSDDNPVQDEEAMAFLADYDMPGLGPEVPAYGDLRTPQYPDPFHGLGSNERGASVDAWRRSVEPSPLDTGDHALPPSESNRTYSTRDGAQNSSDASNKASSVTSVINPSVPDSISLDGRGRVPSDLSSNVVQYFANEPTLPADFRSTRKQAISELHQWALYRESEWQSSSAAICSRSNASNNS